MTPSKSAVNQEVIDEEKLPYRISSPEALVPGAAYLLAGVLRLQRECLCVEEWGQAPSSRGLLLPSFTPCFLVELGREAVDLMLLSMCVCFTWFPTEHSDFGAIP